MNTLRHHSLLIQGGTVIDGTGQPRRRADVAVTRERITAIGDLAGHTADDVVDATGRIVSPGFIDAHSHDDDAVFAMPEMAFKVSQGVTTVVTGNCGSSAAPLMPDTPLPMPLDTLGTTTRGLFPTFAAYLQALRERPASVNVAAMVGHSTLRALVMRDLDRAATEPEIRQMQALVEEAMQAGAVGMSTGTFYPPAAKATMAEIIEVGRPLARHQGLYATHMRDESDHVMASLEESFHIGREIGAPVVISHHKVHHRANFGRSRATLARIGEAMRTQPVALDCYPYTASSTLLHDKPELLDCKVQIVDSRTHPEMVGRDLDDIAREWGLTKVEAARRLQPASAIYFIMDEEDVQRILAFGPTMVGSDGLAAGSKPHPRLWGTFPRVLGRYSRDLGLFDLETAVWKMSGLTAANFGLSQRGTLAIGNFADITVFDPSGVRDRATYDRPAQAAAGIDAVFVNGTLTWRAGRHTRARVGQVITRARGVQRAS